jgi:AcrR family transcriptional regulator
MNTRKTTPRPRRKASGLSREVFVKAARDIVEEQGIDGYTARALADRLGVDATAVYRYFPSLDSVLAAAAGELMWTFTAPTEGTPRQRLEQLLLNVHEHFYSHPNLVPLLVTVGDEIPGGESINRVGVSLLEELGLRGDDLALCHRLLESYALGIHSIDLATAPQHLETRRKRLRQIDHPDLDRAAHSIEAVEELNRRAFRTGLTLLLDYCESLTKPQP